MPDYRIIARDKNGDEIGEFTLWKDLKFEEKLNNFSTCSFTLPYNSDEANELVSLRRYETIIKKDGTIVWAGEQAHRAVTLSANSSNRITITSYSFLEMLNSRYTASYVRFDVTDQGEILKSLLDTTQAQTDGDLGLTLDSADIVATKDRDREYSNQNIMEAWINMANVIDGVDFIFNPDKSIGIYETYGQDKSSTVIFEWGYNLAKMEIVEDFVKPGNRAIVLGSGYGNDQLRITVTDTASTPVFKLREQIITETNVSEVANLTDKGAALNRKYKQPILSMKLTQLPTLAPKFGTVKVGDYVRVKIDDGIYKINNIFRVYSYNVNIDENMKESVQYLVGAI